MTDETQAAMPTKAEIERSAKIIAAANQAGFSALNQVIGEAIDGCQKVIDAGTVDGVGENPTVVSQAAKLKNDLSLWQRGLQASQPGFVPGTEATVVPKV